MKKIKWTKRFTVNIDEIDAQHQELLEITNDIIQDFVKGVSGEDFNNHLKLLRRYAHVHFETEEQYLREHTPELLPEQQVEHRKFEASLKTFFKEYLNNKGDVQLRMLKFLIYWVQNHILKVDKKYERESVDHDEIVTLIDWEQSMSVKVTKMDEQHQYLIQMLNNLYSAILNKKTHEQLDTIIDELLFYTREHFSMEEQYMEAAEYPGLEFQKKAHLEFIDIINECHQSLDYNKHQVAGDLVKFLLKWFNTHIIETDRQYSEHLNQRGIK